MDWWWVLLLAIALPLYVGLLSACAYAGKVFMIRLLFQRQGDVHGQA